MLGFKQITLENLCFQKKTIETIMNGIQDPELNVKKLIAIANEDMKDWLFTSGLQKDSLTILPQNITNVRIKT